MRVAHINVRLAEGGAGQVAFSLHQGLLECGYESRILYGYASGITASAFERETSGAVKIGSKGAVLGNFAAHCIFGKDLFTDRHGREALVAAVAWADVVHLHAIHHYFVSTTDLFGILGSSGKPVVWTLHDFWPLTGRCAVPENCTHWRQGCGRCPSRTGDLPSFLDLSAWHWREKQHLISALPRLTFTAPSPHMADAARVRFPSRRVEMVPNFLPRAQVQPKQVPFSSARSSDKTRILVVAADLSYKPKIDTDCIRKLVGRGNCQIVTMGRSSPFPDAENHGYVEDEITRANIVNSCDVLLFTSVVDSFGMVLIESLAAGLFVMAADSPASRYILSIVGGSPYGSIDELVDIVASRRWADLYGRKSIEEVANICRDFFSFESVFSKFEGIYRST